MAAPPASAEAAAVRLQRRKLLGNLSRLLAGPMTVLAFVWLALLVIDLVRGLSPTLSVLEDVIWGLFVLHFVLELVVAPDKLQYLRRNWLTALALVLPAVRLLRVVRAVRLLRAARAARSVGLVRVLASVNRGLAALRRVLARRGFGFALALTLLVLFAGAAGMEYYENTAQLREAGVTAVTGLDGYGESL